MKYVSKLPMILPLLISGLSLFQAACKHTASGSSTIKHNEGQLVSSTYKGQWQKASEAILTEHGEDLTKVYPPNNLMAKRLQTWADAIHRIVIDKEPELAGTNPPVIALFNSEISNAYAFPLDVCGSTSVLVKGPSEDEVIDNAEPFSYGDSQSESCVNLQGGPKAERDHLAWRMKAREGCEVSLTGSEIVLSNSCSDGEESSHRYKGFRTQATADRIVVYSALAASLDEDMVVGALAHELAHYYRSHAFAQESPGLYDYLYKIGKTNSSSKPDKIQDNDPLHDLAAKWKTFASTDLIVSLPGQKLNGIFAKDAMNIVDTSLQNGGPFCSAGADCKAACEPLIKNLESGYNGRLEPVLWGQDYTEGGTAIYRQYETDFQKCALKLDASKYSVSFERSTTSALHGLANTPDLKPRKSETLWDILLRASSEIEPTLKKIHSEMLATGDLATKSGLGWYTEEQEADELAAEFLVRLGLDPKSLITNNISAAVKANPKEGKLCEANFKNGFPAPVSLEGLADNHHGNCFRAYNIYNELKAHALFYESIRAKNRPVVQKNITWSDAVKSLQN
ncbi:MAG: hypothetical protein EOP07_04550 [Proteobacteria bacterium]|nr:MAG: hypothetical protein EOP07_04550 [Pseudomonadota bacterium]